MRGALRSNAATFEEFEFLTVPARTPSDTTSSRCRRARRRFGDRPLVADGLRDLLEEPRPVAEFANRRLEAGTKLKNTPVTEVPAEVTFMPTDIRDLSTPHGTR
jgi:hypothetical protein